MRTKIIIAAILISPLLIAACDRGEQSPTAAAPSQEKQAMAPSSSPSSPDKMLESAPPAAGTPTWSAEKPPAPAAEPSASGAPASPQSGSGKGE